MEWGRKEELRDEGERVSVDFLPYSPEFWLATPPYDESEFKPNTVSGVIGRALSLPFFMPFFMH